MSLKRMAVCLVLLLTGCTNQGVIETGAKKSVLKDADVELISVLPSVIQETSGLAKHDNVLWTINDSGDAAVVYALSDTQDILKQVKIAGAQNRDWESLAHDAKYLYIADCGNNRGHRSTIEIYKVLWSDLKKAQSNASVESTRLNVEYGDYVGVKHRDHNFDCEALTVVEGELLLFTKNRGDERTNLYRIDPQMSHQVISAEASFPVDGLITAVDYDAAHKRLALLGYAKNKIFGQSFVWIVSVDSEIDWDSAVRYKLHPYAQWEALIWQGGDQGKTLLLSSERSPLLDVSLGSLSLPEL